MRCLQDVQGLKGIISLAQNLFFSVSVGQISWSISIESSLWRLYVVHHISLDHWGSECKLLRLKARIYHLCYTVTMRKQKKAPILKGVAMDIWHSRGFFFFPPVRFKIKSPWSYLLFFFFLLPELDSSFPCYNPTPGFFANAGRILCMYMYMELQSDWLRMLHDFPLAIQRMNAVNIRHMSVPWRTFVRLTIQYY